MYATLFPLRDFAKAFVLLSFALAGAALAAKPDWVQAGPQSGGKGQHEKRVQVQIGAFFTAQHSEAVHTYYRQEIAKGHCPPGLAKKNNGCRPPGQLKAWRVGQRLPAGVVYHDVPNEIAIRIGLPPEGHRLVRIATDILLIAIGTGMVIDAIEDLGQR